MAQPSATQICDEFLSESGWEPVVIPKAISVLNRWTRWLSEQDGTAIDDDRWVAWLAKRDDDVDARHLERLVMTATRRQCRQYLTERQAAVAAATARFDWRILKALYAWLARPVADQGAGERDDDPMLGIKGAKVANKPATRAARADDVAALEQCFPTDELGRRNAAMISLMWRSGLRVGELPHLDLAHYSIVGTDRAVLHVPKTKSDEPRNVGVHPETQRYLARYLRKRGNAPGPLFIGNPTRTRNVNGRITTKAIQDVVRRARDRIGIKISPHQLRRGWTAEYLRNGGDVLSMEILGGWVDHRMPRRYLADEEEAAAIDRYFDVVTSPKPRRLRVVGE